MASIPRGLVRVAKSELSRAARELIRDELRVTPRVSSFLANPEPMILWHEDDDWIGIPRGFYHQSIKKRFDPTIQFNFSEGVSDLRPIDPIALRAGQGEVIDSAMKCLHQNSFGGVIIEMPTGGGKTVTAIELARRVGLKALFVVHTTVLMDQWIEELKRFTKWSVGKIRQDCCDVSGNDVCVGLIHSLVMREYPDSFYDEFGLIVVDEVHVTSSSEFHKLYNRFTPKYFVGLSGTLKRKDGLDKVFVSAIGQPVSGMNSVKILSPVVHFVDMSHMWSSGGIYNNPARDKVIVSNAVSAAKAGRTVLVLGERVSHIKEIGALIKKQFDSVGVMVGESTKLERDVAVEKTILCATSQLLAVGFNKPSLDTLILASPVKGALIQAVGRILRFHDGKKSPMVIDLVDGDSLALAYERREVYRSKSWEMKAPVGLFSRA